MSNSALRKKLDDCLMQYIRKFEKKQGLQYEFSVGDDLLDVAFFGEYCFSMNDIVYDIENSLPVGLIADCFNEAVSAQFRGERVINYQSYAKGARYE